MYQINGDLNRRWELRYRSYYAFEKVRQMDLKSEPLKSVAFPAPY